LCVFTPQKMDVCHSHPAIHSQMVDNNWAGYAFPVGHQSLSAWARALPGIPGDHGDVDVLLQAGKQYPIDHPNVDKYISRRSPGALCFNFSGVPLPAVGSCPTGVPTWHPSIDAAIGSPAKAYPANHIRAHPLLAGWMPASHRDIDMLLASKVALPVGHPAVERWVCANSSVADYLGGSCPATVSSEHPDVDGALKGGVAFPGNHLRVHALLAPYMPPSHR
jgi:hypothetical protein